MYNEDTVMQKNITLSFEFERYLLEHPYILDDIPSGAEVVVLPLDDLELYRINLEGVRRRRPEDVGPVIYIEIDGLAPRKSRLVNPRFIMEPSLA